MKESGYFNTTPINFNGVEISPLDFTSKILFNEWKLGETEEEMTVMRVTVKGENAQGETEEVVYNLHDEYDPETQTSSMARTTGYSATAVVNMFLEGFFTEKGVFPPELIGKNDECFEFILSYLRERKVHYVKTRKVNGILQ